MNIDRGTGNVIRAARRAMGVTQQSLADTLGVSRSYVAHWETGRATFEKYQLAIAVALRIPTEQLMDVSSELPKSRVTVELFDRILARLDALEARLS